MSKIPQQILKKRIDSHPFVKTTKREIKSTNRHRNDPITGGVFMKLDTVLGTARNNQYPVVATAEKDARRSRLSSKGELPVFLPPPCPA